MHAKHGHIAPTMRDPHDNGGRSLLRNSRGATAVEYGLILSLVVIVTLAALNNLAGATIDKWNFVANKVTGV